MNQDELTGKMIKALARAGAHRKNVGDAREALVRRAREQLDSIGPTIATMEAAVENDSGGILSARRLRTLLRERQRLEAVIARHEARGG